MVWALPYIGGGRLSHTFPSAVFLQKGWNTRLSSSVEFFPLLLLATALAQREAQSLVWLAVRCRHVQARLEVQAAQPHRWGKPTGSYLLLWGWVCMWGLSWILPAVTTLSHWDLWDPVYILDLPNSNIISDPNLEWPEGHAAGAGNLLSWGKVSWQMDWRKWVGLGLR